ncbi:MAG: GDP-L-fucose synthase [Bacteriovorax sp.]|nr:GDP-L-fucose synthase [Bacteriovorax sp.]
MKKSDKILILGARGLVGSAITRQLKTSGYNNLLTPVRDELNLLNQQATLDYFEKSKPQHVVLAAARVGGIHANNTYRADFIWENLAIQNNVFEACFKNKVDKLLFLGSSCIYPLGAPLPLKEESLLTAPLEPTNEPYAIAKIAGLKMAESFRRQYGCNYYSIMPTNLYGINDNFHPENSHVIPGLIARMKKAIDENSPTFEVWGSGNPRREFLYVDDMARACVFIMEYEGAIPDLLNVGTGEDISIKELAFMIKKLMDFKGELVFNTNQPDGNMRKVLDVSRIKALGWKPEIPLEEGLKRAIDSYLEKIKQ